MSKTNDDVKKNIDVKVDAPSLAESETIVGDYAPKHDDLRDKKVVDSKDQSAGLKDAARVSVKNARVAEANREASVSAKVQVSANMSGLTANQAAYNLDEQKKNYQTAGETAAHHAEVTARLAVLIDSERATQNGLQKEYDAKVDKVLMSDADDAEKQRVLAELKVNYGNRMHESTARYEKNIADAQKAMKDVSVTFEGDGKVDTSAVDKILGEAKKSAGGVSAEVSAERPSGTVSGSVGDIFARIGANVGAGVGGFVNGMQNPQTNLSSGMPQNGWSAQMGGAVGAGVNGLFGQGQASYGYGMGPGNGLFGNMGNPGYGMPNFGGMPQNGYGFNQAPPQNQEGLPEAIKKDLKDIIKDVNDSSDSDSDKDKDSDKDEKKPEKKQGGEKKDSSKSEGKKAEVKGKAKAEAHLSEDKNVQGKKDAGAKAEVKAEAKLSSSKASSNTFQHVVSDSIHQTANEVRKVENAFTPRPHGLDFKANVQAGAELHLSGGGVTEGDVDARLSHGAVDTSALGKASTVAAPVSSPVSSPTGGVPMGGIPSANMAGAPVPTPSTASSASRENTKPVETFTPTSEESGSKLDTYLATPNGDEVNPMTSEERYLTSVLIRLLQEQQKTSTRSPMSVGLYETREGTTVVYATSMGISYMGAEAGIIDGVYALTQCCDDTDTLGEMLDLEMMPGEKLALFAEKTPGYTPLLTISTLPDDVTDSVLDMESYQQAVEDGIVAGLVEDSRVSPELLAGWIEYNATIPDNPDPSTLLQKGMTKVEYARVMRMLIKQTVMGHPSLGRLRLGMLDRETEVYSRFMKED